MTTSQITVGVHIGWITSLSRRGPISGPGPAHLAPDADSRPEARSRRLRRNCRKGTLKEPVCAPTDFGVIVHEAAAAEKHFSLHDDPPRVLLEHRLADAVDLLQILRLLERTVGIAVVDDLLRRARTHARRAS